jgi:hypothetical protein
MMVERAIDEDGGANRVFAGEVRESLRLSNDSLLGVQMLNLLRTTALRE